MKNDNLEIMAGEEVLRKSLSSTPDGRPLAKRVFFDDDSWQLEPEYLPLVQAHAEYLRDNPKRMALVTGYTQGVARQRRCWLIGERRSRAVVRALLDAGVKPSQLAGISKGEMKPGIEQDGRSASYRRRVNIQYVKAQDVGAKLVPPPGAPAWYTKAVGAELPVLLQAQ